MNNIYNAIQNVYNMDKTTWQEVLAELYNLVSNVENKFNSFENKFGSLLGEEVTRELKKMYDDGSLDSLINDKLLKKVSEQLDTIERENIIFNKYSKPFFVAHRGVSEIYPENSIPAFEEVGNYNRCSAIETDVMLTSDNEWVCIHDETIDRTTDGTGNVNSFTLEEIRNFKIDYGNNVEMYPNLKIPTLKEYLSICEKYNKIPYIEMKMTNCTKNHMQMLLSEIDFHNFINKCVIISFNYEALQYAREINKNIMLGYLCDITDDNIKKCKVINSFICPQWKNTTPSIPSKEDIKKAHQNGLYVSTWTINLSKECLLAINNGVDVITTDILVGGVE